MKILKNLFGSKNKEKTKYDGNTLAEMNGSPDMRLATAKEKEWDAPFYVEKKASKKEKKEAKKASEATKAETEAVTATQKSTSSAGVKKTTKSTSTAKKTEAPATAEAAKKATATTKKSNADTKTSSPKKASTAAVKPVETEIKTEEKKSNSTKKQSTNSSEAQAPQTAKKPAATAKKPSESSAKKTTTEAKKATATTEASAQTTDEITESKATKTGKFEIKKSKDGRFVFNLYASNKVIVATSQIYSSSTSAMNGIKSVMANASVAQIEDQSLKKVTTVPFPKWEIYQDKGEQYRFRLCASNGSCVCHSQGYTTKANCKKGIESIIKFASDAEITKVYLEKKDK